MTASPVFCDRTWYMKIAESVGFPSGWNRAAAAGVKVVGVNGEAERVPTYRDGIVELTGFVPDDVQAHLADEDEQTARGFGWWPRSSTEHTVRRAFDEWAASWRTNGAIHTFAVRSERTGELLGGCQLRKQADGSGHVSYWTGARHRGRGSAQRALRLLCRHAQGEGITWLEAHVSIDNTVSQETAAGAGFAKASQFVADGVMIRYVWAAPGGPPVAPAAG